MSSYKNNVCDLLNEVNLDLLNAHYSVSTWASESWMLLHADQCMWQDPLLENDDHVLKFFFFWFLIYLFTWNFSVTGFNLANFSDFPKIANLKYNETPQGTLCNWNNASSVEVSPLFQFKI